MKYFYKFALVLSSVLIVPIPVDAQISTNIFPESVTSSARPVKIAQRKKRLFWRVGVRPSRYRVGAFSRSVSCSEAAKITAFVPPPRPEEKISEKDGAVDITLSSHPTLWIHLASIPKNAQAQFTLWNATGTKELYNKEFSLPPQTGILGIRLPNTGPALRVDESYVWHMKVQCGSRRSESDTIVGSWIQRINPAQIKSTPEFDPKPVVQQLARATDRDKPALYAELGVWQDAVTSLITLRQRQPNNPELKDDWRNLLTGAQMNEFVNTPILGVK